MMKNLSLTVFIALPLLCIISLNAQCLDSNSLVISWHAFKTPKKTAVKGTFQSFTIQNLKRKPEKGLRDQVSSLSLTIDPLKFSTGNKARDSNIKKYFFSGIKQISLEVTKVTKRWINTTIRLGTKKHRVPFRYHLEKNEIKAYAHIDLLDFKLSPLLQKLNEACFSMHEGKTWSHVEANISGKIVKCTN